MHKNDDLIVAFICGVLVGSLIGFTSMVIMVTTILA